MRNAGPVVAVTLLAYACGQASSGQRAPEIPKPPEPRYPQATAAVARAASLADQECSPLLVASRDAAKARDNREANAKRKKQLLADRLVEYCSGRKCPYGASRADVEAGLEKLSASGDEAAFRGQLEEHKKVFCSPSSDAGCAYSKDLESWKTDIYEVAQQRAASADAERRVREAAFAADRCVKKHAAEIASAFENTTIPHSSWHTSSNPSARTLGAAADEANSHAELTGVKPLRWCRYKDGFVAYSSVVEDVKPRSPAASPEVAQVAFAIAPIRSALDPNARRWHGVAYVTATDVEFAKNDDDTLAWRVLHDNDCAPALPSDLQRKTIVSSQRSFEFLYVFERSDPYKGPVLVPVNEDEAHLILGY